MIKAEVADANSALLLNGLDHASADENQVPLSEAWLSGQPIKVWLDSLGSGPSDFTGDPLIVRTRTSQRIAAGAVRETAVKAGCGKFADQVINMTLVFFILRIDLLLQPAIDPQVRFSCPRQHVLWPSHSCLSSPIHNDRPGNCLAIFIIT